MDLVLTLRQLYYQLVSRDVIPNKVAEYAKLSTLLKEGRMGGIVDWAAIEDRLRVPYTPSRWDSPADILKTAAKQFSYDRMTGQDIHLEVWVEKDALSGVLKKVTSKYHVPLMVNRGYSSASAMYDSFERFEEAINNDKRVKILYLGDFDPSGKDMIRDIRDRSIEFLTGEVSDVRDYDMDWFFNVEPIALTSDQIEQYNPPPNPAKVTDPRAADYIAKYGNKSWEVDALKPELLHELLELEITNNINLDQYDEMIMKEELARKKLKEIATNTKW